ncbi:hypothetical protein C1884_07075 [Pseudomonas sp. GW460-R15]|nr:hypothetical protein C1887_18165 [Pseudomonas sp. GW456-R21]POA69137.1 hypothetical protein C1884_07075 [Pseudomonas sp. GW460-R15]
MPPYEPVTTFYQVHRICRFTTATQPNGGKPPRHRLFICSRGRRGVKTVQSPAGDRRCAAYRPAVLALQSV